MAKDIPETNLNAKDIVTVDELARRLHVSKRWIYERSGKRGRRAGLPILRQFGRLLRFDWNAVTKWLQEPLERKRGR